MDSRWMTAAEVAAYLPGRRSKRFVLREVKAGRLRAARLGGRGEVVSCREWAVSAIRSAVSLTISASSDGCECRTPETCFLTTRRCRRSAATHEDALLTGRELVASNRRKVHRNGRTHHAPRCPAESSPTNSSTTSLRRIPCRSRPLSFSVLTTTWPARMSAFTRRPAPSSKPRFAPEAAAA